MTYLVGNKRTADSGVYVGRPTPLGNPFRIGPDGSRAEVIQLYTDWFYEQLDAVLTADYRSAAVKHQLRVIQKVHRLKGEVCLLCWCAPKLCHANVVAEYLTWLGEKEIP